ncbi:MAG TPA: hypothetical protein VN345_08785 [Blastocatellia bacterium]|nr:hypothetical protein [Blastocatellia bacterium]
MPRTTPPSGSLIKKTLEFTREARSGARRALGLKPKPKAIYTIESHLRDPQAMEALLAITDRMMEEHREQVMQDFEQDRLSPLTRYVIYMAFLETVSQPVRPLALHPQVAFWLVALPDELDCYYPADPCWECGYRYPGTSEEAQAASLRSSQKTQTAPPAPPPDVAQAASLRSSQKVQTAPSPLPRSASSAASLPSSPGTLLAPAVPTSPADPHPWAGRRCFYCGGEIVNHLEWLSPNPKRTLPDFQNAPYRRKHQAAANPGPSQTSEPADY